MNIVDVIKSQLSGEVLAKLSSLVGENEDKIKAAIGAAVPGLLSVLANLATGGGADKLVNALKQVDPGSGGGLGDVLAGQADQVAEKGGSLLNILLGSSTLPVIISILSKFSGVAAGPLKSLLSYLAPLILASIAKQFSGTSLTPSALSSFFAEQKGNINAALPPGLSLANLPGLTTTASPAAATAPAESSGLPGWLLPLVGLCLLAAVAWYFFGNQPAEVKPGAEPEVPVKEAPVLVTKEELKAMPEHVVPKLDLPDPTKIGTDLTSVFTSLTGILGGVKDVPTAETAAPKLTDLPPKIDGLKTLWDKLPESGKAAIGKIVADHLGTLKDLVAKVLAIPGVSDKLKPVLDLLVAKLSSFQMS